MMRVSRNNPISILRNILIENNFQRCQFIDKCQEESKKTKLHLGRNTNQWQNPPNKRKQN